jgi:hypothetical protein
MRQHRSQHGERCNRLKVGQSFEQSALLTSPSDRRQNLEQQLLECTRIFSWADQWIHGLELGSESF